jgi:hypothetical protein
MIKYLILGLEASTTRVVSQIIASNLNIIDEYWQWDGHDQVSNSEFLVVHRSLPYGKPLSDVEPRKTFPTFEYIKEFDYVIMVTRDWHCALASKVKYQQPNKKSAYIENGEGINLMKKILEDLDNVYLFSYESAFLLQDIYLKFFLRSVNIELTKNLIIKDINEKYFNLNKLVLEYLKDEL